MTFPFPYFSDPDRRCIADTPLSFFSSSSDLLVLLVPLVWGVLAIIGFIACQAITTTTLLFLWAPLFYFLSICQTSNILWYPARPFATNPSCISLRIYLSPSPYPFRLNLANPVYQIKHDCRHCLRSVTDQQSGLKGRVPVTSTFPLLLHHIEKYSCGLLRLHPPVHV